MLPVAPFLMLTKQKGRNEVICVPRPLFMFFVMTFHVFPINYYNFYWAGGFKYV